MKLSFGKNYWEQIILYVTALKESLVTTLRILGNLSLTIIQGLAVLCISFKQRSEGFQEGVAYRWLVSTLSVRSGEL